MSPCNWDIGIPLYNHIGLVALTALVIVIVMAITFWIVDKPW